MLFICFSATADTTDFSDARQGASGAQNCATYTSGSNASPCFNDDGTARDDGDSYVEGGRALKETSNDVCNGWSYAGRIECLTRSGVGSGYSWTPE